MSRLLFLKVRQRFLLLVLSVFLSVLAPAANAATKYLSMIDSNGKSLVSTNITIKSPDGSSTNVMTDEKGILQYNFKQTGKYTLSDPAGNVVKTISIAGGGVNSKTLAITAVVAGAALLLVAAGSSGDSSSSSDTPADPVAPPDPEEPPIDEGSIAGLYNVTTSVANNPGDLPVLIDTLVLRFEIIGTQLTIIQTSSNSNFPAQLSGTIAGESFTASSNGTYDDVETLFQLAGSISLSAPLNFLINIGSDGSFPDGGIITYNATGTK